MKQFLYPLFYSFLFIPLICPQSNPRFIEKVYVKQIPTHIACIMGADIGGTNSNFGIFDIRNRKLKLILSLHYKSTNITNFTTTVRDICHYLQKKYNISITAATFACAGVVSEDKLSCKHTQLGFVIDAEDILRNKNIVHIYLANDFEVIGFGTDTIDQKNLLLINGGEKTPNATRAIFGAGTGLGKCILIWDHYEGHYMPLASEGGHADFSAQNKCELELIKFIKKSENRKTNIRWEDILSGAGISRLYAFFCYKKNILPSYTIHDIFPNKNSDEQCFQAYQLFAKLYGRFAKNVALDSLCKGGIYIAGGIAAKYPELFQENIFMQEFTNHFKHTQLLKSIPIYVITDYNVSLYGAAQLLLLNKESKRKI